jgi:probable O-glycosylation ligase (exosortase A-associated)
MRDIALTLVIGFLLLRTLRRADTGAYLWAWLSLMNPHRLTWGFAGGIPFAQLSAIFAFIGLLFSRDRRPPPMTGGVVLMLMLWGWMTVTSFFSINPSGMVWDRWIFMTKVFGMMLVTMMLVHGRQRMTILIWVVVGSIFFYSVKGGLFTILTGGNFRVWGPPGMLEGNNPLAVATLIVLPLAYYLYTTLTNVWFRRGMLICMALSGISVLGSQSRGALVALLAMATVFGLKSKHPVRFSLFMALLLAMGVAFMPESWTQRMDTIQDYRDDTSALSRIYTWTTLWNMAIDRPLVGVGFHSEVLSTFQKYAPQDSRYVELFDGKSWVSHSIYFEAMGEHGFVGLALFVSMYGWVWFAGGRLAKRASAMPEFQDWMPTLLRMCQVGIVAYAAGGAFLSLMKLDLPLYLLAFVTMCKVMVEQATTATTASPGGAPSVRVPVGYGRGRST